MKDATRQASIEGEVEALSHLKTVALKADQLFDALEHLAHELAEAANAVRVASGPGIHTSFLIDAQLQFQLFLQRAAHPLTQRGHVPLPFMKFQKFSECLPDATSVRTRKRP